LPLAHLPRLRILSRRPLDAPTLEGVDWEIHLDHAGQVCAYTSTLNGADWLYLPRLAWYRFSDGGVEAYPDEDAHESTLREAFARIALPMALQVSGREVLHASAVSAPGGVHVFCGASRAGKSTIAFALSRRGFEVWADDAVAFTVEDGRAVAIPLPFALRLRPEVADFFGVPTRSDRQSSRKSETLRHKASGSRGIASVSLLERGLGVAVGRTSPGDALPAVLYHSFYFSLNDPEVLRRMSMQFLELVASVPVFRVSLPVGLNEMNDVLDEFERRVLTPFA
jgi:hypothetical protein